MSNTDKTTRLIQWQRITIAVLFLAFLSMTVAAGYQARRSEVRLRENQKLRRQVSEYETEMRRCVLTPADIEYLRWFKEFDQSCRAMSKQQAVSLNKALYSFEEDDLERVAADAMNQWRLVQSRFREKSPPPACQSIANIYSERLGLTVGQVNPCISMMMAISSQRYDVNSPQGRKWSKIRRPNWERQSADLQRVRATTGQLNAALEQISHLPGTPLPEGLKKIRVSWVGVLLD